MARVSTTVLLGMTVLAAATVHAALTLRSPAPWIVPDELIYSELAKSIGEGGTPAIRGESTLAYGVGYPLLLAPVWALFEDVETAYAVAKVVNALVLGATAIPAFLLARRFVDRTSALVVAALTVGVPSMLYAGTLLTEVALYPTFVLALLAITAAIERPRLTTQIGALAAIGLACAIKVLAVVLVPAFLVGVVLYHWLDTRDRSELRGRMASYAPLWLLVAAGGMTVLIATVGSGARPADVLGAYDVVLGNVDLAGAAWWTLLHLAELDLYLAVIPFLATGLVLAEGLRSSSSPPARLFAALCLPVCASLLVAVGSFASTASPGGEAYPENVIRLHERSTFVLAPLFFVGLALWLRARAGSGALVGAVVVVGIALPAAIPVDKFDENVRFQALALVPWVSRSSELVWPLGGVLLTAALGSVFVLASRARLSPLSFVAPVALAFAIVAMTGHASMREASIWARSVSAGGSAAWIDRAVGPDASISVIWMEPSGRRFVELDPRQYVVFGGEFFNRSLGEVFEVGSPLPYNLPSTRVRMNGDRLVLEDGRPAVLGEFVFAPCHVEVGGPVVARDAATGAGIYRVTDPLRVTASPHSCEPT